MVRAGVAKELAPDNYYFVNDKGQIVSTKEELGRLQVKIEVNHRILFGDGVGIDISQKNDGDIGGQKFVTANGTRANVKSSYKDDRMTAIGLTAASGDSVITIIIFTTKELTFDQRMGHDICIPFNEGVSIA